MLELCMLPAGADEDKIKHKALILFLGKKDRLLCLSDHDCSWNSIGLRLTHIDWTDVDTDFASVTGIILDLRHPIEPWEIHSPCGDLIARAISKGTPCLAIGVGAEVLGEMLLAANDAHPGLNVVTKFTPEGMRRPVIIDVLHRTEDEIRAWQKKFKETVHIIGPNGEWYFRGDYDFPKGVREAKIA